MKGQTSRAIGRARGDIEQAILKLCEEPKTRENINESLDYPADKIRVAIQELLYAGRMTTTPEVPWKYETAVELDTEGASQ